MIDLEPYQEVKGMDLLRRMIFTSQDLHNTNMIMSITLLLLKEVNNI